ncbi:unnamed protein product [Aphanomyces euteiches]
MLVVIVQYTRILSSMSRLTIFACLLLALTSFVCVEPRQMFADTALAPIFQKIVVKDSKGKCKKEAIKHKVSQWGNNCATIVAAVGVGLRCAGQTPAALAVGGVSASILTFKSSMDSYIDKECARLEHVSTGVEKVKNAVPKLNAVQAFNDNKRAKHIKTRAPRRV